MSEEKAEVLRQTLFAIQVCVPVEWTDGQVEEFAEGEVRAGTTQGWRVKKDGEDPERVPCEKRARFVHIVLEN